MHASRFPLFSIAAASWLASGCWSSQGQPDTAPDDTAADADSDSDVATATDLDSDSDVATETETGSDVATETESEPFPCDNGVWTGDFFSDGSLAALAGYTEVTGNLYVIDDDALEDLGDLACLVHVGGTLWISATSLAGLSGLDALESAAGVIISDNASLLDLEGLGSLAATSVLDVRNNDALVSVDGVDSLVAVYMELRVRYNPLLADLDGLGNVTGGAWDDWLFFLDVQSNPELPTCEATELRDQFSVPPDRICIGDNLPDGCPEDMETCLP